MMKDTVKQIIVLRADLAMLAGKAASQAAHASIRFLTQRLVSMEVRIEDALEMRVALSEPELLWVKGQFTKIVTRVPDEESMWELNHRAVNAGLQSHMVVDSGHTVFDGVPTLTAMAIGPDYSSKLNPVTGHLELF
jgi:peptidyl-tRNA hydrolase, PTH2 family